VKAVVLPGLRYRRLWMLLGLAMVAFVTVVCLMPGKDVPNLHVSDKFEHTAAFAVLAFWFGSIVVRRDYFWLALLLVMFGGLIEVFQGLMGLGREADLLDWRADSIGVALGMLLAITPLGKWAVFIEARLGKARA
jgi:VanZ family protein